MYSMLVLQGGIAPDYVLDRMEMYEMETLIEYLWMKNKESWEQVRSLGYITAQCQSTKKLSPESLMSFTWDKEKTDEVEDTEEDRIQVMKEMKMIENKLNKIDG